MQRPRSESEVLAAAAAGEVAESPYLDVKRELDGNNRETAKDIASFAIDGGALLIGLAEERETRRFTPAPITLDGVAERLEQIAENRIDPPLPIRVFDISTDEDPTRGYVWVEIPASDAAPHMVGGIYYARGDRTTRRLSDAEVVRLHRGRATDADVAAQALDEVQQTDPAPYTPPPAAGHGRLYVVAQPLNASRSMAEALLWTDANEIQRIVTGANLPDQIRVDPTPGYGAITQQHPDGQALRARGYGGGDEPSSSPYYYDLLFRMDGGIRVRCGRMTDEIALANNTSTEAIIDMTAVGYAYLVSQWAAQVAERTGYRGAWALGLHATGLQDRYSHREFNNLFFRSGQPAFPDTSFRATIRVSTKELGEEPGAVAYRLTRRMLRSLNNDAHYRQVFGLGE